MCIYCCMMVIPVDDFLLVCVALVGVALCVVCAAKQCKEALYEHPPPSYRLLAVKCIVCELGILLEVLCVSALWCKHAVR